MAGLTPEARDNDVDRERRENATFEQSLVEPLWRNTTVALFAGFVLVGTLLLGQGLAGSVPPLVTIIRGACLGALVITAFLFWRERRPGYVLVYALAVLVNFQLLLSALIVLTGGDRSDFFGALYMMQMLPALLVTYSPKVVGSVTAGLFVPALVTVMVSTTTLWAAVDRALLMAVVSVFAVLAARSTYLARRRSFDALAELRTANQSLRDAHAHLVQAEKLSALGTLSACVAHEISQPLTLLTGYAGVLAGKLKKGDFDPDATLKQVEIMQRAAKRMTAIIDHLRRFGRRSGRARRVALNDVVGGALLFVEGELERAGVALHLELCPDGAPVMADAIELEQIALNLLLNARDAVRGREGAEVAVRTGSLDGTAWLEVRDNGPGIAAEMRENLFQPFATSKPEGKGTGLGLWVSHSIARHWSGELTFESGPDGGAAFKLSLPRTNADPSPSSTNPPSSPYPVM